MTRRSEIFKNLRALFADRASRVLFGFIVTAAMARYLGPADFGAYSYAIAIISLLGLVGGLGMNTVLVQAFIGTKKRSTKYVLGTALALQAAAGGVSLASVYVYTLIGGEQTKAAGMLLLMSLSLPLRALDVIRYWFEAGSRVRITAWIDQITFLISISVRLVLIVYAQPVEIFAAVVVFEALLSGALLSVVYLKSEGAPTVLRFSNRTARALFLTSYPLFVSAIAYAMYTRFDQILVAELRGAELAGIYALSSRMAEYMQFVPLALVLTLFPKVLESRRDLPQLHLEMQSLFNRMAALTVTMALCSTVVSSWGIPIVFGSEYAGSAVPFALLAWTNIFFAFAIVTGRYLTARGLQRITMWRHILGGTINVGLNLVAVPRWGAVGAAGASLITFALANYFFDLCSKETRPLFLMKTRALCFVDLWRSVSVKR